MDVEQIGQPAPDFTLKDQNREGFQLSQCAGKKVLLSFHPLAWTSVCAKQMESLEANKESFDALNTIAVGVSVDSVPCKAAWAKELGIEQTRLLSDFWPHGDVASQLGIFQEAHGISKRANVIVDESGKVAFVKIYEISTVPDIEEILGILKSL
jgi:peroxiredoxin